MTSIRQYLRTRILWGASAILTLGTLAVALFIRGLDIHEFDEALESKARTLATLVLREGRNIEVNFAGEYMPEFETVEHPEYFQFRSPDGSVIERSDRLGDRDLPFLPEAAGTPVFLNLLLPDGRRGRFVQIFFPPRSADERHVIREGGRFQIPHSIEPESALLVLALARGREDLDAFLLKIYLTLAGVDLILLGLIAGIVQRSLRKGFQPLASVDTQIRALSPDALERRIHIPHTPVELQTMLSTLNAFIAQLQAAFAREKRFTTDAAHELRTPVSEFRAACEVGAKWADDPALVQRRFENLRESAERMSALLDALLELSQLDREVLGTTLASTPVAALVNAAWDRAVANVGPIDLRWDNQVDRSLNIDTEPVKLGMIVRNLLANAISHSVPNSIVTCAASTSPTGERRLSISNQARQLTPGDLEHLFERFWRGDPARAQGAHFGLGLSIVKSLAPLLGIRIEAELTPAGVLTMTLVFSSQSFPRNP